MSNNSETSWRDNANISKEIEENNDWEGDLKLPVRKTRVRFTRVPDFTDADFDWSNPEAHIRAREQRLREQIIAVQEMRMLQNEINQCYYKHRVNHYKYCRDLAVEYIRRLSCPGYVCDPERHTKNFDRHAMKLNPWGNANSKVRDHFGQELKDL